MASRHTAARCRHRPGAHYWESIWGDFSGTLDGNGHTFVAGGQPCTITSVSADGQPRYVALADKDGMIDFQYDRTAPMTFYGQTLARVVGRVAGGVEEAGKPLGFHRGKGNLGTMVLRFTPSLPKEYVVNDGKKDTALDPTASAQDISVAANAMDSIATATRYPLMQTYAEVETDPETGEYMALLPPVDWKVTSVKAKRDGATDFDLSRVVTSVSIDLNRQQADTPAGRHRHGTQSCRHGLLCPLPLCRQAQLHPLHRPCGDALQSLRHVAG